ncbi:MAG: hypothetical protein K2Y37_04550 [Pirellulales bacterium]|nr:hypothetical protein [Pirellulales bacterium]
MDSFDTPADFLRDLLNYRDSSRAEVLSRVTDFLVALIGERRGNAELHRLERWATHAQAGDYRALAIPGFAIGGFQYLRMLFGANTTKPDVHIVRYVATAIGGQCSAVKALSLLEHAAQRRGIRLRDLDTTIWENSAR